MFGAVFGADKPTDHHGNYKLVHTIKASSITSVSFFLSLVSIEIDSSSNHHQQHYRFQVRRLSQS